MKVNSSTIKEQLKISLERLNEIREMEDEGPVDKVFATDLPANKGINLHNLTFTYPGAGNEPVFYQRKSQRIF